MIVCEVRHSGVEIQSCPTLFCLRAAASASMPRPGLQPQGKGVEALEVEHSVEGEPSQTGYASSMQTGSVKEIF